MVRRSFRRLILAPAVVWLAAALAWQSAAAQETASESHGLSAFGQLGYPADFAHFAYVNPAAPKGGEMSTYGFGSFDSLNPYIRLGNHADPTALALLHDSLMARAYDEPDAVYGLLAERARLAADRSWVEFDLRPDARFADGSPVMAADVAASFAALKTRGSHHIRQRLVDVEAAEEVRPRTVRYRFMAGAAARDLPMQVAGLPVFPAVWAEGEAFDRSSLDAPPGSGPYEVVEAEAGRRLVLERRADYWGGDLPVNRGRFNFDRIVLEYFRDHTAAFEAFKAGTYGFREEYFSKLWATAYNFPAIAEGRVKVDTVADGRPSGAQGFWINTRRPLLADIRVREALDLAYDFEWANRTLFFDQYHRTDSFFEGSSYEAEGAASAAERALLEAADAALDEEDLGKAYTPTVTDGSGRDRRSLRRASALLEEAGWRASGDGLRRDESGETLELEILIDSPSFERIVQPYVDSLRRIGIDARYTRVDAAQYEERRKSFDYDVIISRFSMALVPGAELAAFYSSASSGLEGSYNLAGVSDPAVDRLLDAVREAEDWESLATALAALDRTLRAGHYWVPQWASSTHRIAWWDRYGRPDSKPPYDPAFLDTWWSLEAEASEGGQAP